MRNRVLLVAGVIALAIGMTVGFGGAFLTTHQVATVTTTRQQILASTIAQTTTLTVTIQQSPLAANPTSFLGNWRNTDPNTSGNVRLEVFQQGGFYQIRIWGQCHPDPCDWGNALLNFYATGVEGGDRYYAVATYQFDFKTVYVILSFISGGTLQVTTFNHFTDASGRSDYFMTETFQRYP